MAKKAVTFKSEIRHSFILYAIIPTLVISLLFIVGMVALWFFNLSSIIKSENASVCQILDKSINSYIEKTLVPFDEKISDIKYDSSINSKMYYELSSFVSTNELNASFALMDETMQVIMQGGKNSNFVIEDKTIQFGTLGRARSTPLRTVVEISNDYNKNGDMEIIIAKMIVEDGIETGCIVFMINENVVKSSFKPLISNLIVANKFGKVFASSNFYYVDEFKKVSDEYYMNESGMKLSNDNLVYTSELYDSSLVVYSIANVEQLKMAYIAAIIYVVAIVLLLILGIIKGADRFTKEKTATIDEIVDAFRMVENGKLDNRLHINSNEEFETIADAHNKMLDNIKVLIETNNKKTIEKYMAEIKQLEMQFNPHFLFNTLETIKFLVKLDPDRAQETIVSLSSILRYSIDNSKIDVTVEEDLKFIENYMQILKSRFGKKIDYSIEISDEAKHCQIPKLIIQPAIENAVKYGFQGRSSLNIDVSASKVKDNLVLMVTDNGKGFDKDLLVEMNKILKMEINNTDHLGMYNVSRRIKLLYGDDYGVQIKSREGFGTTVIVTIPYVIGEKK
ncbi:MAG: histidine kinase [Clostridia bacterium]